MGAFGLAAIRQVRRHGALMIGLGLLFSGTIMLFAISPSLILGCLLLFLAGVSSTAFGTIIATFLQAEVPNDLRGRIMSLYAITFIGLPSLGALASGAIAQALGGIPGAPRRSDRRDPGRAVPDPVRTVLLETGDRYDQTPLKRKVSKSLALSYREPFGRTVFIMVMFLFNDAAHSKIRENSDYEDVKNQDLSWIFCLTSQINCAII